MRRSNYALFALSVLSLTLSAQVAMAQTLSSPVALPGPAAKPELLGLCLKPPPVDPNKDFLGNFNNSCYALTISESEGRRRAGDLNALYNLFYYKVTPGYELVITGTYPNARFFSVSVYDAHAVTVSSLTDNQIKPLNSSMSNPYVNLATYKPGQQYGVTVGFGGGQPTTVSPGCSTSATTIDQNFLDGSQLHQGISWTGYPDLPKNFPPHMTGANEGGAIIIRSYDPISSDPAPTVMVRQLSDGCAVPANKAGSIVTLSSLSGGNWSDSSQVHAHEQFAFQIEPVECFPPDPNNDVQWTRGADYVPGDNYAAGYLGFDIGKSQLDSLISGKQFIRFQFQMPSTPTIPCTSGNCSITGAEQLRYRSISLVDGKFSLASIKDADMVKDANGNVTLIIGLGTAPPSYVTAANNYTYFDLTQAKNWKKLASVVMRDILPNPSFNCSDLNIPFFTTEYNPEGGYMGNFVPTVDFPTGAQLPRFPTPPARPNTCSASVTQSPNTCGTLH